MRFFSYCLLLFATQAQAVPNLHTVDAGIYRSGAISAADVQYLKTAYGVKTILSLETYIFEESRKAAEIHMSKELGITWLQIPMQPVGDISIDQVKTALWIIEHAQKPLLFHCMRGSERTGIVGAAYRLVYNHWSWTATHDELHKYGFSWLMREWEEDLYDAYITGDLEEPSEG